VAQETTKAHQQPARQLGSHVRHLRLLRKLTLSDVGEMTGLSVGMLSMIERGRSNPSIGSLHAVADALGVPMASLVQGVTRSSDAEGGVVRSSGQRVIETTPGAQRRVIVSAPERRIEVSENRYQARTGSGEVPTHHHGFEIGFVLEGHLEVTVDGRTHLLSAGDAIHFESRKSHRFFNPGPHQTRTIWVNLSHETENGR
jgi:transcriptional regulator with XRE-family HTH domain